MVLLLFLVVSIDIMTFTFCYRCHLNEKHAFRKIRFFILFAMYTFEEQTDMLLVLGFCNGNRRESVRVYHERFPHRQIPNHQTFGNIERRLRETGQFQPKRLNAGRPRQARNPVAEEEILEIVENNPGTSCRLLEHQTDVTKSTANRIIREQLIHPYHVQPVQELLPIDFESRLNFAQTIQERRAADPFFHMNILFTDESCFTRRGITNFHNQHVYAEENPHTVTERHFQREFKLNVWMGIINTYLIGPFRLPDRLAGDNYLYFITERMPELLEIVPLNLRRDMVFMHDGAPPHFALNVRNFLNGQYPGRWIGRGHDAPIRWPPRSPDLNPCDFFIWGALKTKVYEVPINNVEQLWNRIQIAANSLQNEGILRRVHFNFLRRLDCCINEDGGHIEHLL